MFFVYIKAEGVETKITYSEYTSFTLEGYQVVLIMF